MIQFIFKKQKISYQPTLASINHVTKISKQ